MSDAMALEGRGVHRRLQSSRAPVLQRREHRQQLLRVGSARVVGVHLGVRDRSVGADQVTRRHGQGPARVPIRLRQIEMLSYQRSNGRPSIAPMAAASPMPKENQVST